MDEHLLAGALAAISAPLSPLPLFGAIAKPMSALALAPFQDEVSQPLIQFGFLLPSGAVLPLSEVGGSPISEVQSMFGCPLLCCLPQRLVNLREEVISKWLVVLSGARLMLVYVFKL